MPKKMEQALKKQASKRGYKGKRADAFVYGTMRNKGWEPKPEHSRRKVKPQNRGARRGS